MKKTVIVKKIVLAILILNLSLFLSSFGDLPKTGVGLRFNSFGIPNSLMDLLIYEYPEISGTSFAFEIRSFGSKGPKSIFSGLYSIEYSKMGGEGPWRVEQYNRKIEGSGEVTQVNFTATVLMNIFPSFPVHPYIGAGIGLGRISIWSEGTYTDELGTEIKDTFNESYFVPVGHIPVGLMVNILDKVEIRLEGGFKNGFYFGGGAVYYF
jgi:hypothetical protein